MPARLERLWYEDSAGAALLAPLAGLYGLLSGTRRGAYRLGLLRPRRLTAPVVVVGNLTVGGTGKTPLTIYLARELSASKLKVGIVSRGYGRRVGIGLETIPVMNKRTKLLLTRETLRALGDRAHSGAGGRAVEEQAAAQGRAQAARVAGALAA